MNYKSLIKKETKVIAYVVICLTLMVIGISYAMFLQVNKNSENQVVETGTLVITYKNGNGEALQEGDIITNSVCLEPMADEEALSMSECSYKLNILNSGSLPASYKLMIYNNVNDLPEGGVNVNHSLIRIGISKGKETLSPMESKTLSEIAHTTETEGETAQNNIKYVLDTGVLEAGEDITYSVQAWLNEALVTGAVTGEYVYLKLEVSSVVSETADVSSESIVDTIRQIPVVTEGNGLYEVSHEDAEITYTEDNTKINHLKQTELRYAGSNPNNYVEFNNELWRIIGLVNTPEGQRIKLIRNESIGSYSWDSSESNINGGYGINEWSTSKLKDILNTGVYYNRESGTCYNNWNNATVACDFSSTGLTNESKNMIDNIPWNIGSNDAITYTYENINTNTFYNLERSNNTGKTCSSSDFCNDTVSRTTTWLGMVGLMYPSDYGYATSGGVTTNRETCLNTVLHSWNENEINDCKDNDWLYQSENAQWTLTPLAHSTYARRIFIINSDGLVGHSDSSYNLISRPSIYLKTIVKIVDGNGTIDQPFKLNM